MLTPLPFAWRTTPNSEAALAFIPRAQSTCGHIVLFAYAYMWVVLFGCSGTRLDLTANQESGFDVCDAIRNKISAEVPVLMFSCRKTASDETVRHCYACGTRTAANIDPFLAFQCGVTLSTRGPAYRFYRT